MKILKLRKNVYIYRYIDCTFGSSVGYTRERTVWWGSDSVSRLLCGKGLAKFVEIPDNKRVLYAVFTKERQGPDCFTIKSEGKELFQKSRLVGVPSHQHLWELRCTLDSYRTAGYNYVHLEYNA